MTERERASNGGTGGAMHVPVLRERVLGLIAPAVADVPALVVDATVGLGGHAAALLAAFPSVELIGVDRDPQALSICADRLAAFRSRVRLVHAVYDALPGVLADVDVRTVAAVLFDLGVSSLQLDADNRGFAYSRDTGLDMRMDPSSSRTAAEVVNTYPAAELARVLRDYGEERYARRIAEAIVRERATAPLSSTARLAELVRAAIPAATRRTGGHPAKRTFQALRIEVNDELGALERALPAAIDAIRVGGRVVVISYQSLEDRLVKRLFAAGATESAPPDLPVVPESNKPQLRLLTRGAEQPTPDEIAENPRATSARLRAVERIRPAA
ncbi:MAG TPA: 16S rRNA (cytosine(1402)-N(4))-methyltransferase RsmH [Mycobacteriales bacterium]|nr:16S rRNA (cytosine(1402)-N(4))-methyltransferase RsmH [Mycobacteriales bacterium]